VGRGTNCSLYKIVPLFGECRHREAQPYTKFSVGNYFGVSWPSILPRRVKRGRGGEGDWGKVGKEIPLALAILVKVL